MGNSTQVELIKVLQTILKGRKAGNKTRIGHMRKLNFKVKQEVNKTHKSNTET